VDATSGSGDGGQCAVVVAVRAVGVVQVTSDEEVDVVAVRHGGVTTAGAVGVRGVVRAARVARRARGWVGAADLEDTLIDVAVVGVVEVTVVEVVDVVAVLHGGVTAVRAVDMGVLVVGLMGHG